MDAYRLTLSHFLYEEARKRPGSSEQLTSLLTDVAAACKAISNLVRHGSLTHDLGAAVGANVQDETQKALDVMANDTFIVWTKRGGQIAALASEEMELPHFLGTAEPRGQYLLVFDPLDGSSNIEINGPVGTIFSVLRAPDPERQAIAEDFLQPGTEQVAAGYVLYSASTVMVLTAGDGAHEFTLDPGVGEFVLTKRDLEIPAEAGEFAINASNERHWEAPVRRYIGDCKLGKTGSRARDFNMRWVAAMVADVHRMITRGGVFMYPIDEKIREKGGRLRLMYEANPMAFIVEQAGGKASTGRGRIMECRPEKIHQRVPVIMGSAREVDVIEKYHAEG